jgi:hypothetical protein
VPAYFERWQKLVMDIPHGTQEVDIINADFEAKFRAAAKSIGRAYDIKAPTALVCRFIDLAMGLEKDAVDGWVYLTDIFGARVPREVGKVLQQALEKMQENGDVTDKNRWQMLEYLAADYLAGKTDG